MQPSRPDKRKPASQRRGYGAALTTGFQQTTRQVQAMHHAIADKSFHLLTRLPLLGMPARLVRRVHDVIADGVYAAVHHGGGAALSVVDPLAGRVLPERHARVVDSVLNGVFGDYLARSGNPLAVQMGFHCAGHPVELSPAGLAGHLPDSGGTLCVFIHGLCCDEQCWRQPADTPEAIDFGRHLAADMGVVPFYLRYNTGLGLDENGRLLASQLDALLAACSQTPRELVLIGHSMGGLIARRACEHAADSDMPWLASMRMLICLGSPHQGALLEQWGQGLTHALQRFKVSAPLGRIAATRSQGIQHLRRGLQRDGSSTPAVAGVAYRFLGASLGRTPDHPVYRLIGDGLVSLDSATEPGMNGDVSTTRLTGLGHMALLKAPAVYAQIVDWLRAGAGPERTGAARASIAA